MLLTTLFFYNFPLTSTYLLTPYCCSGVPGGNSSDVPTYWSTAFFTKFVIQNMKN